MVALELSDWAAVEVDVSGMEGDAPLAVDDGDVPAEVISVDVGSCPGVEVDETNGRRFSMYVPNG